MRFVLGNTVVALLWVAGGLCWVSCALLAVTHAVINETASRVEEWANCSGE